MFYDYVCPKCGNEEEVIHGMTETPDIPCEKCKTKMNIKITGGSGTHFKGNGWGGKNSGIDSSQAKRVSTTAKYDPIGER